MSKHTKRLLHVASRITELLRHVDGVDAIWIGGSLGRGAGDELSDIDLRVAIAPSRTDLLKEIRLPQNGSLPKIVHEDQIDLGPNMLLRHCLFVDGDIVDLCIMPASEPISHEPRILLYCANPELAKRIEVTPTASTVNPPYPLPEAEAVANLVRQVILINIKHARVVYRGLVLIGHIGIHLERMSLLRLLYIEATGKDCGAMEKIGISLSTPVVTAVQEAHGERLSAVLGAPLRNKNEIEGAIHLLHEETVRCGRALAIKFGFAFPEEMVRARNSVWQRFRDIQ